ncbi:hypothetical protein HZS_8172 [Henneguya salminicola]|nr:hypothetical protein HZS_8172 [Henneguya salminicola]
MQKHASYIIIPYEFQNTLRGESFLFSDLMSESGERTIILVSRRNINYLSQSSSIYLDATFLTVSEIFRQLFTSPPHVLYFSLL